MYEILNSNILTIIIIVVAIYSLIKVSNKVLRKISGLVVTLYTVLRIALMCGIDVSKFIK